MATFGNSNGRNKGKKYIKLKGGEVATPENEQRGREFLEWYGANMSRILNKYPDYNEDVASDTMMNIYNDITLKGRIVKNHKAYFFLAYQTSLLKSKTAPRNVVSLDGFNDRYSEDAMTNFEAITGRVAFIKCVTAPPDYSPAFEKAVDALQNEMVEYVRANYEPVACSLFEIYIALQPEMSYKKLARMLGYPVTQIWPVIGAIKKDLSVRFARKKDILLSLI
jgi:hypothetical protein